MTVRLCAFRDCDSQPSTGRWPTPHKTGGTLMFCGRHDRVIRNLGRQLTNEPDSCCTAFTYSGARCREQTVAEIGIGHLCQRHLDAYIEHAVGLALRDSAFRDQCARAYAAEMAAARAAAVSNTDPVVYFVQRGEHVKIGVTTNLTKRLKSLRYGGARMPDGVVVGPIELLGTLPGGRANESALHRKFAADRVSGEWFRLTPEITAFVAGLACNRIR